MDVLMPTSDVTPKGLAKASTINRSGVILGGDILVIRPSQEYIYGPFLAHSIRADANQVLQLVRGSTVFHLYAIDMKGFTFRAPDTKEQKAICAVLRDLQAHVELLKRRHDKAQAVKQGMMQELLTERTRLPIAEGTV
jgi:type I restriction enzyme, S subunit